MAMTKEEKQTKEYIWQKLSEDGYPTYAQIFWDLDLHLTAAPRVVGFMEPKSGTITINRNLDENQFSVIIRHEILHNYLKHEVRLLNHLADLQGLTDDDLQDMNLDELKDELKQQLYSDDTFNIAADYEISNKGYTEEDKDVARAILLNGETLQGLVTEDEHPEWVDWSVEDMYDALIQERKNTEPKQPPQQPPDEPGDGGGPGDPEDGPGDGPGDPGNGSGGDPGDPRKNQASLVYGSFIDEDTFIDENGDVVVFDDKE